MEFIIEYTSELLFEYDPSLTLMVHFYSSDNTGYSIVKITKVLDSDGHDHCNAIRQLDDIYQDIENECLLYLADELGLDAQMHSGGVFF